MFKYFFLLFTTSLFSVAKLNVTVTILPQKYFVESIGKEKVNVVSMVGLGDSPHTYEPNPKQMLSLSQSTLYFTIGVEFEEVWLPKFISLNPKLITIPTTHTIEKMPMSKHHHHSHGSGDSSHKHQHTSHREMRHDPHTWTSPNNVKHMAKHIYEALVKHDAKNQSYYKKNYDAFLKELDSTHQELTSILQHLPEPRTFMVFHPSWGYFAKAYKLRQIEVEIEGKEPKPKEIIKLIKHAKIDKVSAIFLAPESPQSSVTLLAHELKIPIVEISALAPNWRENLLYFAKTLTHTD
jgi:zinc transport system substrate-binding protein